MIRAAREWWPIWEKSYFSYNSILKCLNLKWDANESVSWPSANRHRATNTTYNLNVICAHWLQTQPSCEFCVWFICCRSDCNVDRIASHRCGDGQLTDSFAWTQILHLRWNGAELYNALRHCNGRKLNAPRNPFRWRSPLDILRSRVDLMVGKVKRDQVSAIMHFEIMCKNDLASAIHASGFGANRFDGTDKSNRIHLFFCRVFG